MAMMTVAARIMFMRDVFPVTDDSHPDQLNEGFDCLQALTVAGILLQQEWGYVPFGMIPCQSSGLLNPQHWNML